MDPGFRTAGQSVVNTEQLQNRQKMRLSDGLGGGKGGLRPTHLTSGVKRAAWPGVACSQDAQRRVSMSREKHMPTRGFTA